MKRYVGEAGQALVLFALFLIVLLGASAIAVDYATWLLTDRELQNVSDHAALAGASAFCAPGAPFCPLDQATQNQGARKQAWASLNQELSLGLSDGDTTALAAADTPLAGQTNFGGHQFKHTVWVDTLDTMPDTTPYTSVGGSYPGNTGIVFARLDRPTRSYLGGIFGISVRDRLGWATAGLLPTDFALELFCIDGCAPTSQTFEIDGQGGVTLDHGDVGSNNTLKTSAQTNGGLVLKSGNAFLVDAHCANGGTYTCPPATSGGGIYDAGGTAQRAITMPPQPIIQYESPLAYASLTTCPTQGQWNTDHIPCVPYPDPSRYIGLGLPAYVTTSGNDHDWGCAIVTDPNNPPANPCGTPTLFSRSDPGHVGESGVTCDINGLSPAPYLRPSSDISKNQINGTNPSNGNLSPNIADTSPDLAPTNFIYSTNLSQNNGQATYIVGLGTGAQLPRLGDWTIRFVGFKTNHQGSSTTVDGSGNTVNVTVSLLQNGTTIRTAGPFNLDGTPQEHDGDTGDPGYDPNLFVPSGVVTQRDAQFSLKFVFNTPSGTNAGKRGGGISWAEVQVPGIDLAQPLIPPGYWHSITIPGGGCAILDPTPPSGLEQYQLPGIYRFGGNGNPAIDIGAGAYLIGDGVTLVFDDDWPPQGGNRGITLGAGGAFLLNTAVPFTSSDPNVTCEGTGAASYRLNGYNPSCPLPDLQRWDPTLSPAQFVAANCPNSGGLACSTAWRVDPLTGSGIHLGESSWPVCLDGTTSNCGLTSATLRDCYLNSDGDPTSPCQGNTVSPAGAVPTTPTPRGVTFYFSRDLSTGTCSSISKRFEMSGSSGSEPGIAFQGVLYAPCDHVTISASNNFNSIGMILAWTAKFNGGDATLHLDYPYDRLPASPYLLEPTVGE
ncbi:MAG: hypothetical protein HY263_02460 [Chloroflexi bacterium]|nr:hypothetical protein [Chloroflexota bacterium]